MNCVIITSVINIIESPLCYSKTRSVFTHEERYNQTLISITSVRNKIPNSYIIFAECSNINPEYEDKIKSQVDLFINFYNNEDIRKAINSPLKSYGETMLLINAFKNIPLTINFKSIFKLSGRYFISDYFDYKNFDNDFCVAKRHGYYNIIFTILFKIPFIYKNDFITFLEDSVLEMSTNEKMDSENLTFRFFNNHNPKYIYHMGAIGRISINGYQIIT
jgi:hypothetical protein